MSLMKSAFLGVVILMTTNAAAHAANITFDSIAAVANGSAFTSTSEAGFTVTSQSGNWQANTGSSFGNPIPSIFSTDQVAANIKIVLNSGQPFTFESFDLGNPGRAGSYQVVVDGLTRDSTGGPINVFTISTLINSAGGGAWNTILTNSSSPITELFITISNSQPFSFNIDNIRVTAVQDVPVPAAGLLMAGVLAAFAGQRLRRRARD